MTQVPPNPKNDFVATPDPRDGRSKVSPGQIWLKIRVPFLICVLLALGVASLLLYTSERRSTRQAELIVSPEAAEALRLRSLQLEAEFEKIRQERFELKEADIAVLEEALRLQEEYITARQSVGTDNVRQQSLRRRLHLIRGERLRHDSDEAEAKALALAKTDEAAAIPLLRQAIAWEKEIETKWEFSGLAEPGRRARLDTRLRRLESAPLWQKGRNVEAEAEKLFAAGKFAEAAAKFDQAIECETEFLARYRDVRNTEFGRSDKLAERRETAFSGQAWHDILTHVASAEAFEKKGEWPAAAQAWQAAVDAFAKLLTDYPKSSFADRTKESAMATRLNFARFHDEIAALRARREQLRAALRTRRADDALRLADELITEARRIGSANTGTFRPEDEERKELEYLAINGAVVRSTLGNIDQNLRPVPASSVRIYRTEIPQGLYASVMGANPSSTRREANPVESVTYAEAEAFANRCGWILGAKVRLPTSAEFTAAAGDLSKPSNLGQAWTAENTDGATVHPVGTAAANASGIHDLIGNVEEWVMAVPGDTRAPVLGGSILSPLGKVLATKTVFKREKNRTLGFRIVIE
jgi:formylglycine-generating enzyme required for sulfatase activity